MVKAYRTHREYDGSHPFPRKVSTGHFEVFWSDSDEYEQMPEGWYWWTCEPGCLPDGEAIGPFNTSRQAWLNARDA